jgi:negative regulator of flagellin synthesis FlgM
MVDKINSNSGLNPLSNINRSGNAGQAQKNPAAKGDRVDFSQALQKASLVRQAGEVQDMARSEKIQALKAQISEGTYQPDLNKVASSLLPFLVKEG